jgi:hypothetical protein
MNRRVRSALASPVAPGLQVSNNDVQYTSRLQQREIIDKLLMDCIEIRSGDMKSHDRDLDAAERSEDWGLQFRKSRYEI